MEKFTKEQAVVISGYTGYLACPFEDFHADVEKRIGHPVFTHQFANPEIKERIKNLYKSDFIAMCVERANSDPALASAEAA